MSGALLQLASMGPQDVYLTSNPEITLFKKVYLRYTNFAIETAQVSFDGGSINFSSQQNTNNNTITLPQTGDLISKTVLVLTLNASTSVTQWGYVNKLGHALIDSIQIIVGSSKIDQHKYEWINPYHDLYTNKSHEERYQIMIGDVPELKKMSTSHPSYNLYIPLNFWYCKESSSSFPICALKNQKFQIQITLRSPLNVINYMGTTTPVQSDLPTITTGYVLVDYIYLEKTERNLFINNNHDYLIEQVQDMTDSIASINNSTGLTFNKQCKYLIWCIKLSKYFTRTPYLVWATDDNWNMALQLFGKLVWLATRDGLDAHTDPLNPVIVFNDTFVNIGQVPGLVSGGNSILASLAAKVSGIILFAENIDGVITAKAIPDNLVLINNTLTMEDMSTTIAEILAVPTLLDQLNFMKLYAISIIDVFNSGNFVDGSDNPIVLSSFQLNGRNKFQQRDGFFYNYLQPYYYFTNSPPDGINTYSFSLNPMDTQPSGTINLGNINSKDLILTFGKYNTTNQEYFNKSIVGSRLRIFTLSYTHLKIVNGQANLTN